MLNTLLVQKIVHLLLYLLKHKRKSMKYNLIIEAAETADGRPDGFIGYVPEIPGANTQGETEEEVRRNIVEAIQLIQEVRKEEALKTLEGTSNYTLESIEL